MFESLSYEEIYKYLRQPHGKELNADIERIHEVLKAKVQPRYTCCEFSIIKGERGIEVVNTNLVLTGNDIEKFLNGTQKCYLLAATLGIACDKQIDFIQKKSMRDGLIADAIADVMIEQLCDTACKQLSENAVRYSPGYGDLPLDVQPIFLSVLNAQKVLGMYCTKNNMMIPRKSVTAVVSESGTIHDRCYNCLLKDRCSKEEYSLCGEERTIGR